jgi:hypothetical protein
VQGGQTGHAGALKDTENPKYVDSLVENDKNQNTPVLGGTNYSFFNVIKYIN